VLPEELSRVPFRSVLLHLLLEENRQAQFRLALLGGQSSVSLHLEMLEEQSQVPLRLAPPEEKS
jgi:hypothetical protein